MIHGKHVGTVTLGATLILLGGVFLIHQFIPFLTYQILMTVWPCILIFLGIEVLLSYFFSRENPLKFDGVSIFLTILLTLFSLGMAGADFIFNHVAHLPGFLF